MARSAKLIVHEDILQGGGGRIGLWNYIVKVFQGGRP